MDIRDPVLPGQKLQAANYLIACYAVSLLRGETILCKKVKYITVKKYIKVANRLRLDRDEDSAYHAPSITFHSLLRPFKNTRSRRIGEMRSMMLCTIIWSRNAMRTTRILWKRA